MSSGLFENAIYKLCLQILFNIYKELSKFLRQSLMIFISKSFWTIIFVFIVFFTTFQLLYPPALEIIQLGKSFLKFDCLIKQGAQELWRSFTSNVFVFYTYPRSITRSFMRWFLSVRVFGLLSSSLLLFFYLTFLSISYHIVFVSILDLLSRPSIEMNTI